MKWLIFLFLLGVTGMVIREVYYQYEYEIIMWLVDIVLKPDHDFDPNRVPEEPNYFDPRSWAALPNRTDSADSFVHMSDSAKPLLLHPQHLQQTTRQQNDKPPRNEPNEEHTDDVDDTIVFTSDQEGARADLFYLPPTGFYSSRQWNADPFEHWLIHLKDAGMTPQQATALNGVARVYCPRIREMAAYNYFSSKETRRPAFEIAYRDVERAFLHYLEHWSHNQTRPLFLLGHSQGTELLLKLIEDHVGPQSPVRARLVAAYLIGFPVYGWRAGLDEEALPVCQTASQFGCLISWRTFATGGDPHLFLSANDMLFGHSKQNDPALWRDQQPACVNPLSWQAGDGLPIHRNANLGAMALIQPKIDFHRLLRAGVLSYAVDRHWSDSCQTYELVTSADIWPTGGLTPLEPNLVGAWCHQGVLWIEEEDLPWFAPLWRIAKFPGRNYHAYDINLYWANIRHNAQLRLHSWFQAQETQDHHHHRH